MTLDQPFRPDSRQRSAAFSVIEIMVAVSLLAVIIVGLLAMFYQVQRAFRAGTAQVDVMEGGRAAMNLITRDLQEMVATSLPLVTNCVVLQSQGTTVQNPSSVQELSTGAPRDNYQNDLCFVSRRNDEWIGTSYRVAFAGSGVGTLYRLNVRTNGDALPYLNDQIVADLSQFVCTNVAFDGPDLHRVLEGVVHLSFTPCDTNGVSYPQAYKNNDPASVNAYTNNIRIDHQNGIYAFLTNALPAFIDIELAVLEPSAFEKFKARSEQDYARGTNYLARQIGRTHVFRQRVPIRPSATDIGGRLNLASP